MIEVRILMRRTVPLILVVTGVLALVGSCASPYTDDTAKAQYWRGWVPTHDYALTTPSALVEYKAEYGIVRYVMPEQDRPVGTVVGSFGTAHGSINETVVECLAPGTRIRVVRLQHEGPWTGCGIFPVRPVIVVPDGILLDGKHAGQSVELSTYLSQTVPVDSYEACERDVRYTKAVDFPSATSNSTQPRGKP